MQTLIGTSGWMYGSAWDRKFYPAPTAAKDKLAFYVSQFPAAEVNGSFYRLPKIETVKLHRYLTHNKKLTVDERFMEMYEAFVDPIHHLKEKLGMIVVQLPGNFGINIKKLEDFVIANQKLEEKYKVKLPLAFEFRHKSWFSSEVFAFMRKNNLTNITSDAPKWPESREITSDVLYIRLHGHRFLYFSKYSKKSLEEWAQFVKRQKVKTAYIFFDNTARANAVTNARELTELLT